MLYLGIRIILKYEKIGSNINGTLKILILNKITILSREYPSEKKEEEEKDEEEEKKDYLVKYLLKESLSIINHLKELIKKLLKSIKVYSLQNHIKLGLTSFVNTAEYIGYLWAILTIPNSLIEPCELTAEPYFGDPVIDGYGHIDIKINLLKVIGPVVSFLLVKEVRNFIKGYIKLKKEANNEQKN